MKAAVLAAGARRLTASEWWLLAESAVLALVVEAALRIVPLTRILRALERPTPSPDAVDRAAVERIARLARWPYRLLPLPASCLRISLVQTAVLRRRGLPAALRLGVRRDAGAVDFHAWVECGGAIEADAAAYSAFDLAAAREGRHQ
jgi:hypothetical protein